jgi:glucosamine 6-phosphate synthetase-like amidotransferase/phosphosugar isomerase protein
MFKEFLYADAVRGFDSTGIAAIRENNSVQVVKKGMPAHEFLTEVPQYTWEFNNKALIGHNRAATRGHKTDTNAHPFQEGHITLVHNGTLTHHRSMKEVDVDSHAITHSIKDVGDIKTLQKLSGAFALVWYDAQLKEIKATRNEERPLFICETDQLFIIVSEKELAQWICARNKVKINKTAICTPGVLYSFKENKDKKLYIETKKYNLLKSTPP